MSQIDDVIALALREVGVHEQGGNNRGPRVEEYLRAVGLGPGNPWCAAFVCWCLKQAGVKGGPCSGDTWAIEAWGKNHGCLHNDTLHRPEAPKRGDIFLLLDPDNDFHPQHTGIVKAVNSDGLTFDTVEGNTGLRSETDGDGVAAKTRRVYDCSFVRWADSVSPPTRTVKIFAHSNGKSVVIDNVTYPLTDLVVNGQDCSSLDLVGKY